MAQDKNAGTSVGMQSNNSESRDTCGNIVSVAELRRCKWSYNKTHAATV